MLSVGFRIDFLFRSGTIGIVGTKSKGKKTEHREPSKKQKGEIFFFLDLRLLEARCWVHPAGLPRPALAAAAAPSARDL
mgnify:FL=1|jgi:hypothetical protein